MIEFLLAVMLLGSPTACDLDMQVAGLCGSASSNGSQVDVSGTTTSPAHSGGGNSSPGRNPQQPTPPPTAPEEDECPIGHCGYYQVAMLPEVTASDLVSFVPARPTATGEPAGLGVAGMPTNLIATASEQVLAGRLFDYDVRVRFVPAGFRFDHGDGTARTASTGGASWSRLRLAPFSPTATSHSYAAPGSYRASISVVYDASVDFGTGWRPVTGAVVSAPTAYDVRIVEVSTALVQRTCAEDPHGPGC